MGISGLSETTSQLGPWGVTCRINNDVEMIGQLVL